MKNRNKAEQTYSVDRMMHNVASSLLRDFQRNFNDPSFCSDLRPMYKDGDIARIREFQAVQISDQCSVAEFKAAYQIDSLYKRFRCQNDIYSDEELIEKAIKSFRETQSRVSAITFTDLDALSTSVLRNAAAYISKILGVYNDEEHRNLCRFGKRASVGIPARSACLAARWELPISGSLNQIDWFDSEMSQDCAVREYWASQKESDLFRRKPARSIYQPIDSLRLTLVPKTFKSLRSIMPNTTIGSYMSYGLGEMIRKRLKRDGYDISSLQMRHRYLAQSASIHSLWVTADLSSASDSISVALVEKLLPPDWFEILNKSRIGKVLLPDGSEVESQTFCTMGIGYTFPLQTLIFLALLKGIQGTLYHPLDRRTISVYGDDMIYSSRMHNHVVHFFEKFGFVINLDKTFHEGEFRESCGGDYFRGVDVRPFQPRKGATIVCKKAYEAVLYKFTNGLLARWSEHEIGGTLDYLTSEIESLVNKVKLVPCDYPDDSGVKCPTLTTWGFLSRCAIAKPKSIGHGIYRFSFLRLVSSERKEVRHVPYYWNALRDVPLAGYSFCPSDHLRESPSFLVSLINELTGVKEVVSELVTRELKPIEFTRGISGKRLRRCATYVTISHTGRYTRQSGTSCFEDRR